MKFIIGKKIEMTQIWKDGKVLAVTKVKAGPCRVSQVKDEKKDGYSAVQVAFGNKKEKRMKKPQKNHLKKVGLTSAKVLKEFRIKEQEIKEGDIIKTDTFVTGEKVNVQGTSKGKGFAGVVKRYGFAGARKTHGTKDQLRMPGSIGCTGPAHVFKGVRMGGRMGGETISTQNLEIAEVDNENGFLFIKGSVPGSRNSLVFIKAEGELKISENIKEEKKEEKEKVDNNEKENKEEKSEEENKENKEEKIEENNNKQEESNQEEKPESNKTEQKSEDKK